jgi:hypothetical protein
MLVPAVFAMCTKRNLYLFENNMGSSLRWRSAELTTPASLHSEAFIPDRIAVEKISSFCRKTTPERLGIYELFL